MSESARYRHHRGRPGLLAPVTLTVHLEDIHMACQSVEQSAGHSLRSKHLGSLAEWQDGGDDDPASLVSLAEFLKGQFRAGPRQGNEAQFVDDQQRGLTDTPRPGKATRRWELWPYPRLSTSTSSPGCTPSPPTPRTVRSVPIPHSESDGTPPMAFFHPKIDSTRFRTF